MSVLQTFRSIVNIILNDIGEIAMGKHVFIFSSQYHDGVHGITVPACCANCEALVGADLSVNVRCKPYIVR